MQKYFSTFFTGFTDVIVQALHKALADVEISYKSDGLVIYQTKANFDDIKRLPFFNNSFVLLKLYKDHTPTCDQMLQEMLAQPPIWSTIRQADFNPGKRLRIMATNNNQLVSLDPVRKQKLEQKITQITQLRIDRSHSDLELLFATRSEGLGLVGLRFTKGRAYERTLQKGELYPELAYILCYLSRPTSTDVFLDPFCGSGAIPLARTHFSYKKIYAGDLDKTSTNQLQKKVKQKKRRMTVMQMNATHLKVLQDHSIDKIVTDPPWGIYNKETVNIQQLYTSFFQQVIRVLRPDGLLVILVANNDISTQILSAYPQLRLEQTYMTLVSGRKAKVLVLRLKSNDQ